MDDLAQPEPGSAPDPADDRAEDPAAAHERARMRGPKRLLLWGPIGSLGLALGAGVLGAQGPVAFFLLLLLLAVTFGATGVWVGVGLLVDEFRGDPTSLRRGLLTAGMFVATLLCMTAVGGVATTMESTT